MTNDDNGGYDGTTTVYRMINPNPNQIDSWSNDYLSNDKP